MVQFHEPETMYFPLGKNEVESTEEFPRLERYELSCLQQQMTDYIYLERYELGTKYEYTCVKRK